MQKIKNILRQWLEIDSNEYRINTIENKIFHEESKMLGFAVLKRHLNRPDKPLPKFRGKDIEQD